MTGMQREIPPPRTAFGKNCDRPLTRSSRVPEPGRATATARRYVFPRYPFSLVYILRGGDIEIVAVAHGRRRPGYWQARL